MKLYKLIFNNYENKDKTTIKNKKGFYIHDIDKLIIQEDDIKEFEDYGNGIKEKICIGKLFKD